MHHDSPYLQLVQLATQIDYLAYNCHLTTNCYLETMVRYGNYFVQDPSFMQDLCQKFYSPFGIGNPLKAIASPSVHQMLRLVERTC